MSHTKIIEIINHNEVLLLEKKSSKSVPKIYRKPQIPIILFCT